MNIEMGRKLSLFLVICFISSLVFNVSGKNPSGILIEDPSILSSMKDQDRKQWLNDLVLPAWVSRGTEGSKVKPVDNDTTRLWLRHVIPLPKMVRLEASLTLPATGIKLRLRQGATDVEMIALDELEDLISERTGIVQLNGSFQILIGVCDKKGKIDGITVPGADKLSGLKNNDQAYVISPISSHGIAVAGLTGKGVYHGVKTLQQMIRPGLSLNKVVTPVMVVLDWPDIAERGQWGSWENDRNLMMKYIHFMAERKMNHMEVQDWNSLTLDKDGRGFVKLDMVSRTQARLHAINTVYITEHINRLPRTGIFDKYPQAKGTGDKIYYQDRKDLVVPCASNPDFIKVLSEWLESCASQGVMDVNIWLTELGGMRCDCEKCKDHNQYVLETKACVKAWQSAHEKYPGLQLRILTSQATVNVNDQILAAITEPAIRITYYSGDEPGTYYPVQEPIIYPLIADVIKTRGWLGCYPLLSASWKDILPWSCAPFIKFRMNEFAAKELPSFAAYVAQDRNNDFYDFNLTAAAEWSWNAHGRSEWEFAASWATQHGFKDPEVFADWAEMLGPVGWDLYGSAIPHYNFYGAAAGMIKKRTRPEFGKGMYRYFPTMQHLDEDLAVCEKALNLAEQMGEKAVIAETQAIQGYLQMIRAIYNIADKLAASHELTSDQTGFIQTEFNKLRDAERQTTDALFIWTNTIAPGFEIRDNNNPVVVTHKTMKDITAAMELMGIK